MADRAILVVVMSIHTAKGSDPYGLLLPYVTSPGPPPAPAKRDGLVGEMKVGQRPCGGHCGKAVGLMI